MRESSSKTRCTRTRRGPSSAALPSRTEWALGGACCFRLESARSRPKTPAIQTSKPPPTPPSLDADSDSIIHGDADYFSRKRFRANETKAKAEAVLASGTMNTAMVLDSVAPVTLYWSFEPHVLRSGPGSHCLSTHPCNDGIVNPPTSSTELSPAPLPAPLAIFVWLWGQLTAIRHLACPLCCLHYPRRSSSTDTGSTLLWSVKEIGRQCRNGPTCRFIMILQRELHLKPLFTCRDHRKITVSTRWKCHYYYYYCPDHRGRCGRHPWAVHDGDLYLSGQTTPQYSPFILTPRCMAPSARLHRPDKHAH